MLSMPNVSVTCALLYVVAMWPDRRFRDRKIQDIVEYIRFVVHNAKMRLLLCLMTGSTIIGGEKRWKWEGERN